MRFNALLVKLALERRELWRFRCGSLALLPGRLVLALLASMGTGASVSVHQSGRADSMLSGEMLRVWWWLGLGGVEYVVVSKRPKVGCAWEKLWLLARLFARLGRFWSLRRERVLSRSLVMVVVIVVAGLRDSPPQ